MNYVSLSHVPIIVLVQYGVGESVKEMQMSAFKMAINVAKWLSCYWQHTLPENWMG